MPNLCDKESYDCNDLIKIVGILRSPEGCPWDRAQDHHTIRNNFLEEAYEAVEAIDRDDSILLRRRHKAGNSRNARKKDFTVWRIVCGRFPALYRH